MVLNASHLLRSIQNSNANLLKEYPIIRQTTANICLGDATNEPVLSSECNRR